MKTAYMKPTTDVVAFKIENLLTVVSGEGTQNASVSGDDYDAEKGGYFSRRGNIWDDED